MNLEEARNILVNMRMRGAINLNEATLEALDEAIVAVSKQIKEQNEQPRV